MPQDELVINLHPGQQRVMTSEKRFIVAMGGKRGGKTFVGGHWEYREMSKPNTAHLIAAPVYHQLEHSTLVSFFSSYPQLERYYRPRSQLMRLPNGTNVYIKSLDDPKNIEGLNLHSIWVDEADAISKTAWNNLRGRVATTQGRILLTSTIYPSSWIYEEIYQNGDDDFDLIPWESIDNPYFPRAEWEKLQKELDPVTFNREYRSQFQFGAGLVWGDILMYGVINTNQFPPGVVPLRTFVGVDFGYNDPTAITVIQYCSDGNWYIVDEYYRSKMDIDDINHWLEHFWNKYGKFFTIVDSQSAIPKHSLNPKFNIMDGIKAIHEGVSLVRNIIHQRRFYVFGRCVNCRREFGLWSYSGKGDTDSPEDRHNHAMDSIRYVIYTCYNQVSNMPVQDAAPELNRFWKLKEEQGVIKNGQYNSEYFDNENDELYDEGDSLWLDEIS